MLPTWPRFFLHLGCFCLAFILGEGALSILLPSGSTAGLHVEIRLCTCMEISVILSCLFVHKQPYQSYNSVLQSRFLPQSFMH